MTKLTSSFTEVLHEVSAATLTTEIVFFLFPRFLFLPWELQLHVFLFWRMFILVGMVVVWYLSCNEPKLL